MDNESSFVQLKNYAEQLHSIALGLITIETLLKNGITVWASGENIRYKSEEGINKDDAAVLLKILTTRKQDVLPVISDPEATINALSEAREALSEASNHTLILLGVSDTPDGSANAAT